MDHLLDRIKKALLKTRYTDVEREIFFYDSSSEDPSIFRLIVDDSRLDAYKLLEEKLGCHFSVSFLSKMIDYEVVSDSIAVHILMNITPPFLEARETLCYSLMFHYFEDGNFKMLCKIMSLVKDKGAFKAFKTRLKYNFYGGLSSQEYSNMLAMLKFFDK